MGQKMIFVVVIIIVLVLIIGFLVIGNISDSIDFFDRSSDNGGSGNDDGGGGIFDRIFGGGSGSISSGGGSSGGASGSSEGSQGGSSGSGECVMQEVAYSASNFISSSVCNEFHGEVCEDRSVECSIRIKNLDFNVGGVFEIEFRFFDEFTEEEFYSSSFEQIIDPRGDYVFTYTYDVQSTGENGIANRGIDCFYSTVSIPEKEVC
jgi:hypothetical protein